MIKKAELHVHLEGTIQPELAYVLAQRNKLSIPDGLISEDNTHYLSKDFLDFLSVYDTLAALIKTPRDYYDITFDYLAKTAIGGGIYVEMMYSPDHAEQVSNIPSIEHLIAIQAAVDDAKAKYGIVGRIIITAVRHFGVEKAINVAREAAKNRVNCATGFGLGGDEIHYPPKLFKEAYDIAYSSGLRCTVHAGEFAGPEGVIEAINTLPIERIGHGVRAMESQEALDLIKEKNIALEICPSSNIQLQLFNSLAEHPFPKFLEQGFIVSLNSDDPPFMKTTLEEEYNKVQKAYGYSEDIMHNITTMALETAFIDDKLKAEIIDKHALGLFLRKA